MPGCSTARPTDPRARIGPPVCSAIVAEHGARTTLAQWITRAGSRVRVLPPDPERSRDVATLLGVSPTSTLHALSSHVGAMLIDDGWLRILGGGAEDVRADLASWNGLGSPRVRDRTPGFFVVAFDVLGGVFAMTSDRAVHYFAPDSLRWEPLEVGIAGWLEWSLTRSDDIDAFYADARWPGWQREVSELGFDQALHALPPRWTREGKATTGIDRRAIPATEVVDVAFDIARQLDGGDGSAR